MELAVSMVLASSPWTPASFDSAKPAAHRARAARWCSSPRSTAEVAYPTADPQTPLALFLVGMRVHKPLRIRRWWPAFTAMSRMLRQLQADPDLGLLAATLTYTPHPLLVQYWRSLDHLQRFAHDPVLSHRPAWKTFNRLTASGNDTVGLWHEAYVIAPEQTSSLYRNMPRVGLAAATGHAPVGTHRPGQHEPAGAAAGAPS